MLTRMTVATPRRETLEEITERVVEVVRASGVRECLEVVLPVIPHAIEILQARPTDH